MPKKEQEIDDRLFRNAMGSFATGVTVITTEIAGEIHGMTANAFMSISLKPKLIAISVGENARMLGFIKESKQFAVNVLSSSQQNESKQFSGQLNLEHQVQFSSYMGVPVLDNALAVITCELHSEYVVGDHTVFIGQVTGIKLEEKEPLIYSQGKYRELKELQD
jgi:flavin reductase (DIM6/NTAB) family NADH-FMN oxidoreductase RutF